MLFRSQGFGSYLIEKGLPGAKVKLDFKHDGVECNIVLPMPARVQ